MGSPESPEGRGLKHVSAALQFLSRTKAINGKLHLAPACFRSRRDAIYLFRGSLDPFNNDRNALANTNTHRT
jgi:hypothetical protein